MTTTHGAAFCPSPNDKIHRPKRGGGVDRNRLTDRKNSGAHSTADGEGFDPKTGEVQQTARSPLSRPGRPMNTTEEDAEAKRVREERAKLRRAEVAAIRAIDPACETDGDPPVVWRKPVRIGGEPNGVILDVPRVSGRGVPGSRLVLAPRSYDGAGPNGGDAHDYVTAFVIFLDRAGYSRRTIGVALRRVELRDVAAALTRYADTLEAPDVRPRLQKKAR